MEAWLGAHAIKAAVRPAWPDGAARGEDEAALRIEAMNRRPNPESGRRAHAGRGLAANAARVGRGAGPARPRDHRGVRRVPENPPCSPRLRASSRTHDAGACFRSGLVAAADKREGRRGSVKDTEAHGSLRGSRSHLRRSRCRSHGMPGLKVPPPTVIDRVQSPFGSTPRSWEVPLQPHFIGERLLAFEARARSDVRDPRRGSAMATTSGSVRMALDHHVSAEVAARPSRTQAHRRAVAHHRVVVDPARRRLRGGAYRVEHGTLRKAGRWRTEFEPPLGASRQFDTEEARQLLVPSSPGGLVHRLRR